jgi:hypothetical protein
MPKKVIKYKLTPEGSTPSFVEEKYHGWYPSSPLSEETYLIGISVNSAELTEDVTVYETQADLVNYLKTLYYPIYTEESPITIEERAEYLFSLLSEKYN